MDFAAFGALLLLFIPPLAALCVLLTGPVAEAIGRWQREEAQVMGAPVAVAGVALLVEAVLAAVLWNMRAVGAELRVTVGQGALWVDRYAMGGVLAVSLAMLMALVGAEIARPRDTKVDCLKVGSVMFLWATQVALLLAGTLPTVTVAVALSSLGVGIALLLAARLEGGLSRVGLTAAAVLVPTLVWLLLGAARRLPAGPDISEADTALRTVDPDVVRAALGSLWLAGTVPLVAAIALLTAAPRQRALGYAGIAGLVAAGMAGTLPALLRVTVMAFPAGSPVYALQWLSSRVGWTAIVLGVAALGLVHAPAGLWRRSSLAAVGLLCALGWCVSHLGHAGAEVALTLSACVGVTLPLYLGHVMSVDRAEPSVPAAERSSLLWSSRVLEACVFLPWALGVAVSSLGGLVLVAVVIGAGVRLENDLRRLAPLGVVRGSAGARFWVEVGAVVALAIFAVSVGLLWGHASANSLFPR